MLRTVYETVEIHPLVRDLPQRRERKHLKAAAVGEYRAVPVHEFVQSARTLDQLVAGTEIEVVGVGQQYLRPRRLHLFRRQPFHRRFRADGHETRGVHDAVVGVKFSDSRAGLLASVYDFESHFIPLLRPAVKRLLLRRRGCPAARRRGAARALRSYIKKQLSPKEKNRYRSLTAVLYSSSVFSRPTSADTSMMSVDSGRWKLVMSASTHLNLYGG